MCCRVVLQQQHVTHQPAVRKGTGKRRRRLCRLCCLAATLVISFGIYLLAVFAASIVATVPFDPRNQLALQVWREALQALLDDTDAGCDHTDTFVRSLTQIRGCDVNVVTGSASTVEIQRWLGKESSHKVRGCLGRWADHNATTTPAGSVFTLMAGDMEHPRYSCSQCCGRQPIRLRRPPVCLQPHLLCDHHNDIGGGGS